MTKKGKNKNKNRGSDSSSTGSPEPTASQTHSNDGKGKQNATPSLPHQMVSSSDFLMTNTSTPVLPNVPNTDDQYIGLELTDNSILVDMDLEEVVETNDEIIETNKSLADGGNTTTVSETNSIDNNSLLSALQSQIDKNYQAMHTMVHSTIAEAIHQLKSELKSEFKSALDKNRKDFLALKQSTTDQLTRVDLKVTTNLSEMNTRVNSLGDKLTDLEKVVSNSNLANIDKILTDNAAKINALSDHQTSLKGKIESCENTQADILKSISFINEQFEELKASVKANNAKSDFLELRIDNNEICQSRLGNKVNNLETRSVASDSKHRKYNLVFDGITESPGENARGIITNIFNNSNGLINSSSIDTAYRLGKPSESHTRPILVAFFSIAAKDHVLQNATKIKQMANLPNLWINRDQPDLTRKQCANARKCYNLMRQNKLKCTLQGTSITYNGKVYHYKDLNKLPQGSRLEDTKMIPCNDDTGICFQSELSFLSNFYKAPLYFKNKYFEHSEQAFQWYKAICSGYNDIAKQIMMSENPHEVKQLSKEITPSEQWALAEINTLRSITHAKFSQNRNLGERLRTSPYVNFYECTKDSYWGTGFQLPTSTREIDTSKFEGENNFGIILRDVKAKLIASAQRTAASPPKAGVPQHNTPPKSPSKSPRESPIKSPTKPQTTTTTKQ